MPTLPFVQPPTAARPEHTALCDGVAHSNQAQSHLWSPISGDSYDPGSVGRWSLQIQGSSAGCVTSTTGTMHLDAEETRFGYVSPPASATSNPSGFADTGYPLNPAYLPHSHQPRSTLPSISIRPPSSVPILPFRCPSTPFDAEHPGYDPPSMQHDMQIASQVPTGLSRPCPSSELPYHAHHGPPAQARVLPASTGLCMHKLYQTSPVPAVSTVRALAAFQSRPPVYDSLHCNSKASYNETELYRLPPFELDSIHWNSPPTSSGLPMTPPDHTTAPQLPYSSQLRPPKSPTPYYVPASVPHFSPALTGPAFPTGKDKQPADTQALRKSKTSLNEGTKDVFQSLKRKRLPVAATFSRPKPRTLPVKKVLPKIHGCQTCGKMFDRPSTLLVHQASHTKAKDYACNKCRKTFSVNSNMRRHWRNCTDTPKDSSVPSSPSVPIKQEVLGSASEPSAPRFVDSPPMPGPSGLLIPAFTPQGPSVTPREQALTSASGVSPTMALPFKLAEQPPSIRGRFECVSQPEVTAPVPPVQPRMTKAQEEEMKGWFLKEIWRNIIDRLRSWRIWRLCGASSPATSPPPATLSPSGTATLVDEGFEDDDASATRKAKKLWGEERDSWLNKGYATYFGLLWNGVLPGPGPDDPPAVPIDIDDDEETAGDASW